MNASKTPVKVTVDSGFSPRYDRFGYLVQVTDRHVILELPANSKFGTAAIPLVSVADLDDATVAEVESSKPLRRR